MLACGVPWPTVALVLGILALLVIALAIFVFSGAEAKFWVGDPPEDW